MSFFIQNYTYPTCGDCLYGDFRGDYGEPGPQVSTCRIAFDEIVY